MVADESTAGAGGRSSGGGVQLILRLIAGASTRGSSIDTATGVGCRDVSAKCLLTVSVFFFGSFSFAAGLVTLPLGRVDCVSAVVLAVLFFLTGFVPGGAVAAVGVSVILSAVSVSARGAFAFLRLGAAVFAFFFPVASDPPGAGSGLADFVDTSITGLRELESSMVLSSIEASSAA